MIKRTFSDQLKARVAFEALRGEKTINQISSQYQVHPSQIQGWKTIIKQGLPGLFNSDRTKDKELTEKNRLIAELYKIIGQRDIELEWLKKKLQFEP